MFTQKNWTFKTKKSLTVISTFIIKVNNHLCTSLKALKTYKEICFFYYFGLHESTLIKSKQTLPTLRQWRH